MTEEGTTISVKAIKRMADKSEPITKAITSSGGSLTSNLELPEDDSVMSRALRNAGITPDKLAESLVKLMHKKTIKIDAKGKVHEADDPTTQLKAIEMMMKLMGLGTESKGSAKHLHLHGKQINELFGKIGSDQGEGED